jgi:hypothetical protein
MEKLDIMMKQYEFLRKEIVQCIYLRQLAIVGIFTTIVAGIGVLFADREFPLPEGALQAGAIGIALLVNAFGSLYLHEQFRNRRACQFNLILERLMTRAATERLFAEEKGRLAKHVRPVIGWENVLMYSRACKRLNGPFYIARYLGVLAPILIFSVPLMALLFASFSLYGLDGHGADQGSSARFVTLMLSMLGPSALIGLSILKAWLVKYDIWAALLEKTPRKSLSMLLIDRMCTIQRDPPVPVPSELANESTLQLSKFWIMRLALVITGGKSRFSNLIIRSLYLSPLIAVIWYLILGAVGYQESMMPADGVIWSPDNPFHLLLIMALGSVFLGFWTYFIFKHVLKWLGENKQSELDNLGAVDHSETSCDEECENGAGKWLCEFCARTAKFKHYDLVCREWTPF